MGWASTFPSRLNKRSSPSPSHPIRAGLGPLFPPPPPVLEETETPPTEQQRAGMAPSSWWNKRVVAATLIIAWAGVLHLNMMDIQRKMNDNGNGNGASNTKHVAKLSVKLHGSNSEQE
mmetsp:Transcript_1394/g.4005  ORF Transcript_1394/g.4005 Transcript_1394/m.4005 type:complete len:118 (-) Transcript_1394:1657-2010(-)